VKNVIKGFKEFNRINEDASIENAPLRGYSAEQMKERLAEFVEIMPDRLKIGVPSDSKGYTITYRDINGAIQKIDDLVHTYSSQGEEITFYCWSVGYAGTWDATKILKEKIQEAGGFGKSEDNLSLKKMISYFNKNREDVDNIRSISISIDSESIRKEKMNKAEEGPQREEIYPSKEPVKEKPVLEQPEQTSSKKTKSEEAE
jgi:hypothetical protein